MHCVAPKILFAFARGLAYNQHMCYHKENNVNDLEIKNTIAAVRERWENLTKDNVTSQHLCCVSVSWRILNLAAVHSNKWNLPRVLLPLLYLFFCLQIPGWQESSLSQHLEIALNSIKMQGEHKFFNLTYGISP